MIKVRLTFVDDEKGLKALDKVITLFDENTNLISQSKVYPGRGKSKYSNIYVDIDVEVDGLYKKEIGGK